LDVGSSRPQPLAFPARHSPAPRDDGGSLQPSRRGVALVITLILLSVVTFMAITFLALSRRERSAVTTVTDTASARLAADAALANAEAQVIANVLATTNPYNFALLVSTNYINPIGFVTGSANPTNVNYDYRSDNQPFTPNDRLQNLINLFYSPRPPVFIPTNSAGANDFRFYLDLNRNGRFDANGLLPVISPDPANPYYDTNGNTMRNINPGNTLSNLMVGDPEWIGVLERPDAPYGPNNKFIARYAFIAVPVGNTLDLNAIHNQVFDEPSTPSSIPIPVNPNSANSDVYFRNQGVGSWEINLAAFLADLNTNKWGQTVGSATYYQYNEPANYNFGFAFDDARALLAYRYSNNYNSLSNANVLFVNALQVFPYYNIDGYSDGPLQTTFNTNVNFAADNFYLPWAGADNTNHFFTHQELFDPTKTEMSVAQPPVAPGFIERLHQASTNVSTYDRYTFYRLLSQLGTDSAPESGKMNINYDNLDPFFAHPLPGITVTNPPSATNFLAWTPLGFFTNAADRLLRAYTTQWRNSNPTNFATTFYTVTNFSPMVLNPSLWTNYPAFGLSGAPGVIPGIPVLVSNQFVYSSAVNRLLQLAANMYDATSPNFYPSVFRPIFEHDTFGNVFIVGYTNLNSSYGPNTVSGTSDLQLALPYDVTQLPGLFPASFTPITYVNGYVNVYGVPWIIGAKKGFPNFNKFGMQSVVQITRKLQIKRNKIPIQSVLTDFDYTNQLYVFSISNSIGVECWNSYNSNYLSLNTVQIVARDNLSMMLTNSGAPSVVFSTYPAPYSINTNISLSLGVAWPGSAPWSPNPASGTPAANSFIIPIASSVTFLTNSAFYSGTYPPGATGFRPVGDNLGWETNKHDFTFPQFSLFTTNRLQVFMLDGSHVIDYVQFAGPDSSRDLNSEIRTYGTLPSYGNMWNTNLNSDGLPWGIVSQIEVSRGNVALDKTLWSDSQAENEIDGFAIFMGANPSAPPYPISNMGVVQFYSTNYIVQVPYTPTVTAYEYTSWQANDPLVHYLTSDLNFHGTEKGGPITGGTNLLNGTTAALPRPSFTTLNDRYQPWGRMLVNPNSDTNGMNLAFKDPLVRLSDNWDFPANKFPTVGWLGRVHRGTPWQSVYLKASDILKEIQINGGTTNYIGTNTWVQWTGDTQLTYGQYFDAANTAPIQDRLLFDLFTAAFNDNATRGTLSVNVGAPNGPSLAAWSALFSGAVALSNNAPSTFSFRMTPHYQGSSISNTFVIIQPAGPYNPALLLAQQPPLVQLVQGINQTRANTNLFPLQTFTHVGDILSVPQLTEQSPFLNWYDSVQQQNGISDEMYEWLPQQTMSLMRLGGSGSPRYVIYCYGQALKPAPNSIVTSGGAFFGMVTNYQVVSEIATRAVVRFGSTLTNVVTTNFIGNWVSMPMATNNNAVIENFNILPPD
jgi:hypothetical protein